MELTQVTGKARNDVSSLTLGQRKAYDNIISFINNPYNKADYKRILLGAAGTGKTYLVKSLINNSNMSYSSIGLATPTHKACRVLTEAINIHNVKVNTIQSDLGLRPNFDIDNFDLNNIPFDPKGSIKINNYSLYIVDEASMLNRGLTNYLEKICKENCCKIIYIGDPSQLSPVGETYSPALKGDSRITNKLTEIVRQDDDNPVKTILEILRYDVEHNTFNFLNHIKQNPYKFDISNIKGYECCSDEVFTERVNTYFSDPQLVKNVDFVKIIAFSNVNVSNWNNLVRNNIILDSEKAVLTKNDLLISYNTILDKFNEPVIINSEEYIINDIVNYTHPKYNLKGFLVKFTAIYGGKTSAPLFVLDHSDLDNFKNFIKVSSDLINIATRASKATRAKLWREYYDFKESCLCLVNIMDRFGKIVIPRSIDYGFALTSHKSQGNTYDTVLVDVKDIVYNKNGDIRGHANAINRSLYVACSRCKNKLYLRWA